MSRQRSPRSPLRIALVTALAAATIVIVGQPASAVPSSTVVVSEAYGGGGNSGATLTNDFIELQNRSGAAVDVTGWSVQYHPAGSGSWQSTPLTGTIAPGAFYVVTEAKGTGGTVPVPGQATGTIAMSGTGGTVALVTNATALNCQDSSACQTAALDLIGYGAAAIAEGAPVPGASNTASVARKTTADTDSNVADFAAGDPTPGAAGTVVDPPPPTEPPVPGPLRIHDLQGASFVSPLNGQSVTNVPGIVTAVRAAGSSRGFYLQDPTPDMNPATSEGIFVFTSTPAVAVGDSVVVSGTVQDFYAGGTPDVATTLSTTEITRPTVAKISSGNALPAPEVITPTTVPELYAPDLGGANIETTPITPTRSALDFWESREGMRVEVDDARVIGPTSSFGEQFITTKPAKKASYRGGSVLTAENATPSGRVQIVPVIPNVQVSVGDVYSGATVGPVDYSQFGGYLIAATQLGTVSPGGIAPVVATTPAARQLSIATYNVENLAPGDAPSKYAALAKGIVTNLAAPDIIAVEEIQDNDGASNTPVVGADATILKLTDAVVAAGGPRYSSREIDPADDKDGGQPGGNIRNVFLFNPARVTFVDRGAATADRTNTATGVTGYFGNPSLTLSPGRIDPTNTAWTTSRKPLVGEFRFRGLPVFLVANHFNSKGGDGNADGRYQYPVRSSEVQRQQQALLVHNFVQSILKKNPLAQTVVLGDLNDYQFSPALKVLKTGKADGTGRPLLIDLIATLPNSQQYTYVYQGISQVLDHILVTPGTYLTGSVDYQVIHINSEFANQTSDHDPQVVRLFGSYRR
ncbi:putative extracellular nuclease [Nakamurella sp. UYEF19]|uniref:lamin tail domain-containing protein n=1 Tax=Nakamurella sp. UYEF19 TaxID=1756392 RepID=UPI0033927998